MLECSLVCSRMFIRECLGIYTCRREKKEEGPGKGRDWSALQIWTTVSIDPKRRYEIKISFSVVLVWKKIVWPSFPCVNCWMRELLRRVKSNLRWEVALHSRSNPWRCLMTSFAAAGQEALPWSDIRVADLYYTSSVTFEDCFAMVHIKKYLLHYYPDMCTCVCTHTHKENKSFIK